MDTMTTDALLASDPDFAAVCDARRDAAIEHMEATTGLDIAAAYRAHHRTVAQTCAGIVGRGDAEDVAQVASSHLPRLYVARPSTLRPRVG